MVTVFRHNILITMKAAVFVHSVTSAPSLMTLIQHLKTFSLSPAISGLNLLICSLLCYLFAI